MEAGHFPSQDHILAWFVLQVSSTIVVLNGKHLVYQVFTSFELLCVDGRFLGFVRLIVILVLMFKCMMMMLFVVKFVVVLLGMIVVIF